MINKIMRSPFFYVGDKFKLIKEIKNYFPENISRFIEPFSGGGTVFLNIEAREYFLNDIDSNICNIHEMLRYYSENPKLFFDKAKRIIKKYEISKSFIEDIVPIELKKEYPKTSYAKFNKEGYNRLKEDYNKSNKKDPLLLYFLLIYGFNRMIRFNLEGKFNLPVGNVDFNKNVADALIGYFNFVKNKKIKLNNLDFFDFISKIKFKKGDFVYLDPPYLISSSEYNKLWGESEEKRLLRLLDILDKKGVRFALSNVIKHKGLKNNLLIDWMDKYKTVKINSNYISYHDNSKKETKEVLITNY